MHVCTLSMYECVCVCVCAHARMHAGMCLLNIKPWPATLIGYLISYVSTLLYNLALCLHDCICAFYAQFSPWSRWLLQMALWEPKHVAGLV